HPLILPPRRRWRSRILLPPSRQYRTPVRNPRHEQTYREDNPCSVLSMVSHPVNTTSTNARLVDPNADFRNSFIAERLFEARTLIITGEINQKVAASVMSQLLALSSESEEDITVFVNSQGGHVESGDTIHDMLRFVEPRV